MEQRRNSLEKVAPDLEMTAIWHSVHRCVAHAGTAGLRGALVQLG